MKSDLEIMDKFLWDCQKRKAEAITVVHYFNEKDISITRVIYDGRKYYGIVDYIETFYN